MNASGPMGTGSDLTVTTATSALMTDTEQYEPFLSRQRNILLADFLSTNAKRGRMSYRCKMCGYDQMPDPPNRHNICPCCGIEYGVDDAFESYEELRNDWLRAGAPWFSQLEPYVVPAGWNAWDQLDRAGYVYAAPRPEVLVRTQIVPPIAWNGHLVRPEERIRWIH